MSIWDFFTGTQGKYKQKSTLGEEQQPLYEQLLRAAQGQGGGGAFGTAADYYRDLLSNDSATMSQLSAPELRRFNEEIIPGLSEQFAGMGSGGLTSSGFRNAAVNAGTDLSERLGAIRANLRSQGAAGLAGIGQSGLGQYNENIYQQGSPGLLDYAADIGGQALGHWGGNYLTGLSNNTSSKGSTKPYGGPLSKNPLPNTYNSNPYGNMMQNWS